MRRPFAKAFALIRQKGEVKVSAANAVNLRQLRRGLLDKIKQIRWCKFSGALNVFNHKTRDVEKFTRLIQIIGDGRRYGGLLQHL